MQTFLPYEDFARSAACLDTRRLGKQRLEASQILRVLEDPTRRGWRRHPAVAMWRGYEDALRLYLNTVIQEWMGRGFRNSMPLALAPVAPQLPPWLGDAAFHAAHRSNLLRKDPAFYGRYGWDEPPDLPYIWPTPPAEVAEGSAVDDSTHF
jgi:Pyrimidine dimer DNA glycosylase